MTAVGEKRKEDRTRRRWLWRGDTRSTRTHEHSELTLKKSNSLINNNMCFSFTIVSLIGRKRGKLRTKRCLKGKGGGYGSCCIFLWNSFVLFAVSASVGELTVE